MFTTDAARRVRFEQDFEVSRCDHARKRAACCGMVRREFEVDVSPLFSYAFVDGMRASAWAGPERVRRRASRQRRRAIRASRPGAGRASSGDGGPQAPRRRPAPARAARRAASRECAASAAREHAGVVEAAMIARSASSAHGRLVGASQPERRVPAAPLPRHAESRLVPASRAADPYSSHACSTLFRRAAHSDRETARCDRRSAAIAFRREIRRFMRRRGHEQSKRPDRAAMRVDAAALCQTCARSPSRPMAPIRSRSAGIGGVSMPARASPRNAPCNAMRRTLQAVSESRS